ncbi:ribbon-helix-helix domain-containing protein, partial [Candidatus Aerophobetes bacterium]|nr:ribbon-helix-helix domain-containing protein [Candidatus Aerophobetes bacterium]
MKKIKTVGIEKEQLKELKDLSKRTHISESE